MLEVKVKVLLLVSEDSIVAAETPASESESACKSVEERILFHYCDLGQTMSLLSGFIVDLKTSPALTFLTLMIGAEAEFEVFEVSLSLNVGKEIEIST